MASETGEVLFFFLNGGAPIRDKYYGVKGQRASKLPFWICK